jgi:hypothetical protein
MVKRLLTFSWRKASAGQQPDCSARPHSLGCSEAARDELMSLCLPATGPRTGNREECRSYALCHLASNKREQDLSWRSAFAVRSAGTVGFFVGSEQLIKKTGRG